MEKIGSLQDILLCRRSPSLPRAMFGVEWPGVINGDSFSTLHLSTTTAISNDRTASKNKRPNNRVLEAGHNDCSTKGVLGVVT